ncbi:hypothetical protein [Bacteroides sp.]
MLCYRVIDKFSNPAALLLFKFMSGSVSLVHVLSVIASWFPGVGYRTNTDGSLTTVGVRGHFWCSSPNASGSTNGGILNFNSDPALNPVNNSNRVNGFAVRCVSELVQKAKTFIQSGVW